MLLQERAAHHVAAALRDAARPVDAAGLDDPHRPVPVRPPGPARGAAGLAHGRPAPPRGRRAAQAELHAAASSIPTAGSTTRAWWCSTRSTRASAAPTVLTRTRCIERAAQRPTAGTATLRRRRRRGARVRARARWSTPPGPWADAFLRASTAHGRARDRRLRLVKGSHIVVPRAVRPRPRLHLPEPRQAHHLRDPVRGRLHADRHHRRRTPRRDRRRRASTPTRSPTCASRPAATSRKPVDAGRRGVDAIPACARCSTTSRATRRP